jgi:hypothetical protein
MLAERFLRERVQLDQARRERTYLRHRGVCDPKLDGYLDRLERKAAIGTPTACAASTETSSGTSKQSAALSTSASDLIIALAVWEDANPSTITFSDLGSNTWHTLTKAYSAGPGACFGWAVASGATSNNKVTVTYNVSASALNIRFLRVSGCDTSSPFDQQNGAFGTSTAPSAGSITTTLADEIIVVGVKGYAAVSFSNWMAGTATELWDGNNFGLGYRIVSSTGSYTGSATMSPSADWACPMASFKATAASGITGDLAASMPAWATSLAGDVAIDGALAAGMPAWLATLAGDIAITGDLAAALGAFAATLQGDDPITGDLSALIPAITVSLFGDTPITGDLAAQLPALLAVMTGDVEITGALAAAIPGFLTVLRSGARGSIAHGLRRRLLMLLNEEED